MKNKVIRYKFLAVMACCVLALSGCKKNPSPSSEQPDTEPVAEVDSETDTEAEDEGSEPAEEAAQNEADSESEDITSDEAVSQDTAADESSKEPVAVMDIYNEIAESVTLPEMFFADETFMMNYYGIDASKLEEYVFASCLDSTSADLIILIRLKDEASADEVVDGLNTLLEQMGVEMEDYNPEANELVKAAEVRRNGKNIDLIIHEDRETILSIIDNAL